MSAIPSARVVDLRFEHYASPHQLGTHVQRPRLSWKFAGTPDGFVQHGYELEVYDQPPAAGAPCIHRDEVISEQSTLVPWPLSQPLQSRQRVFVRVRAWGDQGGQSRTAWSNIASIEGGLLQRKLWTAHRISSPWEYPKDSPQPEELFRKEFRTDAAKSVASARLYITAQGVYQAEINATTVGDHVLAPGWTVYDRRLRYQCFDVLEHLHKSPGTNVIGVRVAEGWFCGRLGWGGGFRNLWGERPALLAQLEITYDDGTTDTIGTDSSWTASRGPTVSAELYDGEKYDARLAIPGWSGSPDGKAVVLPQDSSNWENAAVCKPFPDSVLLIAEEAEPVRRIATVRPLERILTSSGKTVVDFGQNLVGYIRIKKVRGRGGLKISFTHAEVLEDGELGHRPLRVAANLDEYTLRGDVDGESWEPKFTFHGFRYVQVDGWPEPVEDDGNDGLLSSIEAVVCHTDLRRIGNFGCSDPLLSRLHENVVWSMRGNFLSIPTDCPQRDERLGWTGDLAMFAPTATLLYDCVGMLLGWLKDVFAEQCKHGGVPPLVVPNAVTNDPMFGHVLPAAVWADVAVLAPWALYQATGDVEILRDQYQSMVDWIVSIPRNSSRNCHLWDLSHPQLGDWLDPTAPPDNPAAGQTDAVLVADAFLVRSLELVAATAAILNHEDDALKYKAEAAAAKAEFGLEYISPTGRMVSDSQTAYGLAIVFDLFPSPEQKARASERLAWIVRRNAFKIGTGFAGTPFICEALALAGHPQIAYAMLHNKSCPSWLYPVTMGATTVWERWDSMLPDGSINPGEMTSFNHYALGAVAKFLHERVAGLQSTTPGWKTIRVAPVIGGELTEARVEIETPFGKAASAWSLAGTETGNDAATMLLMEVVVPPNVSAEIVFPEGSVKESTVVGPGKHTFSMAFSRRKDWPVEALRPF
ncbi:glycoside hydrolase family 78 protein [Parathielavia appendiculata]|uniref:alpha-L-rhamnosidase n=1 Tax=Parathielavia appendiculata TaxID=2587402 RepID=A0AAN6YXU4_9PEZI|nr:glycoside hydrolase family 78 protein [Parathielavia appendiculata]